MEDQTDRVRYLSLFSGIEAATQAWKPLGWECVGVSEIEPFPCAVLEHHYPNVPNLGDVTKITEQQIKDLGRIDLVVFGSPCQNLSIAGNRKGLQGSESSLFYAAMEIIKYAKQHCKTRFALWENVPGAFSSNRGADFTEVVKRMAGLSELNTPKNGWGKEGAAVGANGLLEWSVLDAQWFGLAQRRKRVFALLDTGDWTSRPPISLERESLRGDSAPSREARQDFTTDVRASTASSINFRAFGARVESELVGTLTATDHKEPRGVMIKPIAIAGNIIGRTEGNGGNGNGFDESGACYTLTTNDRHAVCIGGHVPIVAYGGCLTTNQSQNSRVYGSGGVSPTLRANGNAATMFFMPPGIVRRLTPIECERLQGFPDNFTQIPYRNKSADDCPNGPRYKALGNSMAVNVMAWIGQKIQQVYNK